jgi:hypothetical protein
VFEVEEGKANKWVNSIVKLQQKLNGDESSPRVSVPNEVETAELRREEDEEGQESGKGKSGESIAQ